MALSARRAVRGGTRRAGQLRRRRPPLRAPRRDRRHHLRRRLRPPARPRSPPALAAARAGRLAPGRVRVPAPPLQPHGGAVAGLRRRVRRRRPARRSPTSTPPARHRGPASRASWSCRRVLDAHPWARVAYLPHRADLVDLPASRAAPRRPVPHAGRRRPDVAARRGAGPACGEGAPRDRPRSTSRAGSSATGPSATCRSARSRPTGSAGRAALFVRPRPTTTSRPWPTPCGASARAGARGRQRARTCLWPTGFAGLVVVLGERFAAVEIDGRDRARRRRRRSLPVRGPAHRRGRAHRLRVGGRRARLDRRRGAHERRRARLGHGRVPGQGPPIRPAQRRGYAGERRRSSTSASAARRRSPTRWSSRPSCASRHGDRATAEAEIAEIVRWRRENQPGGPNAGSVFMNPPRRLGRATRRPRRVQGAAHRHAPRCRPSTPTSSRPTTAARPTTCSR